MLHKTTFKHFNFLIPRMHNGRNVIEGQHCTCAIEDNGRATLTIHDVKCEDAGLYSAIAANKHGKAMSEAPVIGKYFYQKSQLSFIMFFF